MQAASEECGFELKSFLDELSDEVVCASFGFFDGWVGAGLSSSPLRSKRSSVDFRCFDFNVVVGDGVVVAVDCF